MNHQNPSEMCWQWKENLIIIEDQNEEMKCLTKSATWSNPKAQRDNAKELVCFRAPIWKGEKIKMKNKYWDY